MTVYNEDEWADIKATGSPGPRPIATASAPAGSTRTLADPIADDAPCWNCGHRIAFHQLDPDVCIGALDGSCECCLFEPEPA